MSETVVRLHVELQCLNPAIWRRVEVPGGMTLKALHQVIQAVMVWRDYHLFEFQVGDRVYGIPNPDWDFDRKVYRAKSVRIRDLLDRGVIEFTYLYDFGDDWLHKITIEEARETSDNQVLPRFIDGAWRTPPEDVGGAHGSGTRRACALPRIVRRLVRSHRHQPFDHPPADRPNCRQARSRQECLSNQAAKPRLGLSRFSGVLCDRMPGEILGLDGRRMPG